MIQHVKRLVLGKLVRASSWLFIGGIAGGMLGYLFQIIMGRMLSVSEYGIFSALMAIMVVIGAPITTLTMIISRRVSAYRNKNDSSRLSHLFYWINRKILIIAVVLAVVVFFNVDLLQNLLLIEEDIHTYLLLTILLIAFPQAINNGYLQGLQDFKWLSASGVLATILKIIFAVILVYFGLGVSGALGSIVLSALVMLVLTYVILRPSLGKNGSSITSVSDFSFKSALPVLMANVAFAIMTQIDMVLVKHYFSAQEAGLYAAASILGKAVMYLPGGIAMALFPMVAENHASGKSSAHLMFQAVGVTALLSSIGALLYYFLADSIVVLLYGADYKEAANVLKYFGFAMLPMALIMVAEHFLIAMGRVLFAYLFMIVAPLQLIAIYYYHDTLLDIVAVLSISGIILVLSGYGLLWRTFKK